VSTSSAQNSAGRPTISLQKVTAEEVAALNEKKEQEREAKIQQLIGFRKIIDMISKSQKPIVGHNALLDFVHVYHRFVRPAPEDYVTFKSNFHAVFPFVLDTKLISNTNPRVKELLSKENNLVNLHQRIARDPFRRPSIKFVDGFERYSSKAYEHEAGYDALLTGHVLIAIAHHSTKQPVTAKLLAQEEFNANKLFLMSMGYNSYLNLHGTDCLPENKTVFYCCGFPKTTAEEDLKKHFLQFGEKLKISWVDDTSAFVHFYGEINEETANLITTARQTFKAYSFATYREVYEGRKKELTPQKKKVHSTKRLSQSKKCIRYITNT